MFNTNAYFGTDAVLTVSDADGVDARAMTNYFGESGIVARLTDVTVEVFTEIKPFHEIGSRAAKELRAGNIHISGRVKRAMINGALLKLSLGAYAEGEEAGQPKIPTFNMKLMLDNLKPAGDEGNCIITLYGVMFENWMARFPQDDFAMEGLRFKARRIQIEDSEISG